MGSNPIPSATFDAESSAPRQLCDANQMSAVGRSARIRRQSTPGTKTPDDRFRQPLPITALPADEDAAKLLLARARRGLMRGDRRLAAVMHTLVLLEAKSIDLRKVTDELERRMVKGKQEPEKDGPSPAQ